MRVNKHIGFFAAAVLLYLLLTAVLQFTAGHYIVKAVYEEKGFSYLNSLISGRHIYDLDFYLAAADNLFLRLSIYFILSSILISALFFDFQNKRFGKFNAFILSGVIVSLLMLEGLIALGCRYPFISRTPLKTLIENIYDYHVRDIIQLEAEAAKYDPEVFYTLRPGIFSFTGVEFDTEYRVNSQGLRDEEDALNAPDIIVLGDSTAMGWGIDQESTFSEILEKVTGMKVLNAAVASYGTVREMKVLDRLDTSALKYLIISYCGNDFEENQNYYLNKGVLKEFTREQFISLMNLYAKRKKYYPGKYILLSGSFFNEYLERFISSKFFQKSSLRVKNRKKYFLYALMNGGEKDISGVNIIVLGDADGGNFDKGLKKMIIEGNYPEYIKNLIVIDIADLVARKNRFLLDAHPNEDAHKAIAEILYKTIKQK